MVWEHAQLANHVQPDVVFVENGYFFSDGFNEQLHQTGNFLLRPIPVFCGKCIKGKVPHTQLSAAFHNIPYTGDAMEMTK